MSAALIGLLGVLVGGILTQFFALSNDWRNRRMEAMVATVSASIRVLGAHERMHGLFYQGMLRTLPMTA